MRVDLFDFDLPPERIALRPARPRDAARLLVVRPGATKPLADAHIRDLPAFLRPGDVLVVNDTKVLPARLDGTRARGDAVAAIEATLHKRLGPADWLAFVRPAKKLRVGEIVSFGADAPLLATVRYAVEGGIVHLNFAVGGAALDLAIAQHGRMPLPPYIARRRAVDGDDTADYQTPFAARAGAVAAPTASLHFTPILLDALSARGVTIHRVTLHVGAGTFLPVKADDTDAHAMHAEWGEIDAGTATALNAVRQAGGGRLVCAGTTSLRILESATAADGTIRPFSGDTSIFITPGYAFRAADVLLTNFHLPRSTLFMLTSAFSGLDTMHAAYAHAIENEYRFYSYGDACLLHRAST